MIQLSPPLVSDAALLDRIVDIVGTAADRAWTAWSGSRAATADPRSLPQRPQEKRGAA